jgi:hypothetical protein
VKVTADQKGRIASKELFPSGQVFDATREPDGSIRIVEMVAKQVREVRPRRVNGRLVGALVRLDRGTVAAACRAERDER